MTQATQTGALSYRRLTNTWKDAQHHSLSEKCNSKPQWGTISRWSEWLLSKSLQTINAGEGVEKREPSPLLHCWCKWKLVQPLWRTVWRFLKKLETELPYNPAIPLVGIHTEETKIERDTNVHHSTVYNSQDMEATQMFISRWMDKKAVVHIHNGILLSY